MLHLRMASGGQVTMSRSRTTRLVCWPTAILPSWSARFDACAAVNGVEAERFGRLDSLVRLQRRTAERRAGKPRNRARPCLSVDDGRSS